MPSSRKPAGGRRAGHRQADQQRLHRHRPGTAAARRGPRRPGRVAGVITNNSVEATVRMAGNLGFQTWVVADGCFTFGRKDWNGAPRADEVHAMSLANLDGEYCMVVTAEALLGRFA